MPAFGFLSAARVRERVALIITDRPVGGGGKGEREEQSNKFFSLLLLLGARPLQVGRDSDLRPTRVCGRGGHRFYSKEEKNSFKTALVLFIYLHPMSCLFRKEKRERCKRLAS